MAHFVVPQFIEFESKIVGPLSLRQFAFIAASGLISFLLFFILSMGVWIVVSVVLVSVGISLALVKVNGRPLYFVAMHGIRYFWQPKLYLWKPPVMKEPDLQLPSIQTKRNDLKNLIPNLSKVGRLWQDLTTTKNPIPKREKVVQKKSIEDIHEQYEVFRRVTGERQVARRVDYR